LTGRIEIKVRMKNGIPRLARSLISNPLGFKPDIFLPCIHKEIIKIIIIKIKFALKGLGSIAEVATCSNQLYQYA